jgi:hypothetical protein
MSIDLSSKLSIERAEIFDNITYLGYVEGRGIGGKQFEIGAYRSVPLHSYVWCIVKNFRNTVVCVVNLLTDLALFDRVRKIV